MPRQAWAAVKGLPVNPLSTSRSRGGCRQTAEAIAAVRDGHSVAVHEDQQLAEVATGTGQASRSAGLAKDSMWRMAQASR